MWPKHPIVLALIFLLMTVLMACQPGRASPTLQPNEVEVPFETIASEEWGSGYESQEPQVFLLTTLEAIAKIAQFVNPAHLEQLRQVDFEHYAVVAAFQGVQPSSNYKVVIERITIHNTLLTVYAQFWQPSSAQGGAAVETSPYHLIRIARDTIVPVPTDVKFVNYVVQP